MELGVHLPLIQFGRTGHHLDSLKVYAGTACKLGYGFLAANDHLVFGRPWMDGPTALAAVMGESGSMGLMTSVIVPVLRGPVATAKMLTAIDLLSNGRLTVAVGPGSSAADYDLVGIPFEERWKRLDESIQVMRAVWRGETFQGQYYSVSENHMEPGPKQQGGPPIWIGSWGSVAGMRRVHRLGDGWLASAYNTDPQRFGEGLKRLADADSATQHATAVGTMWAYVTEDDEEAAKVLEDVLCPMLGRDPAQLRHILPIGSPEHCGAVIRSYKEAGVGRLLLWPIQNELSQLKLLRDCAVEWAGCTI